MKYAKENEKKKLTYLSWQKRQKKKKTFYSPIPVISLVKIQCISSLLFMTFYATTSNAREMKMICSWFSNEREMFGCRPKK